MCMGNFEIDNTNKRTALDAKNYAAQGSDPPRRNAMRCRS
jgi:hypothetical protein